MNLLAIIIASNLLILGQATAQVPRLTQPETPNVEILQEIESEKGVSTSGITDGANIDQYKNLDKRQVLLRSKDRIGFGAATTGGVNEILVNNIAEFAEAVTVTDSYIRFPPTLAGQTLTVSDSISITGENITIDGSDAPGMVISPSSNFPNNRPMLISRNSNIIINDLTLDGRWYPNKATFNNVAAIRFFGNGIWVNKVTVTGFWDDAFDVVLSATNATFSNIKTFSTNKSMHLFYPTSSDRHVSLHSSELSARERNPWNQGALNFHMWNNYIHDDPSFPYYAGTYVGNTKAGYASNKMNRSDPAYTISENNVFEGENAFLIFAEGPPSIPGSVHSNNDDLGGGRIEGGGTANGVSNFTATTSPSLFEIPYNYTLQPTAQVKSYVTKNAGASRQ